MRGINLLVMRLLTKLRMDRYRTGSKSPSGRYSRLEEGSSVRSSLVLEELDGVMLPRAHGRYIRRCGRNRTSKSLRPVAKSTPTLILPSISPAFEFVQGPGPQPSGGFSCSCEYWGPLRAVATPSGTAPVTCASRLGQEPPASKLGSMHRSHSV